MEVRHDYRLSDGTPSRITGHGGFTTNPGTESTQIFPADQSTTDRLPSFWDAAWVIQVHPGERYVYTFDVVGSDEYYRTEYDLSGSGETL
jgi:hypothetical protein